ncbi:hypothetical protein [Rugamonas sp.]|uniref:hypothetical protein n=1 Tax=Rugamonas sp. TaxID=1926287 RepID=UPI0025EF8918|nr:hypothetical protein [Rugamonas sp.]
MKSIIITTSTFLLLSSGVAVAAPHHATVTIAAGNAQFEWDRNDDSRLDWEAVPPENTVWYNPAPAIAGRPSVYLQVRGAAARAEMKKAPLSPVPEPGVTAMLLVGFIILMLAGRVPRDEKFIA